MTSKTDFALAPCPVTGKPCGCWDWCDKLPKEQAQTELIRIVVPAPSEKEKESTA